MMKYVFLIFVGCVFVFSKAQVVINEVSASNVAGLEDNYGEHPDWVELYNAGNSSVNLQNYALTDNTLISDKWVFPNVTIGSKEYLIVYLSGRNVVDAIDHWESAVLESNSWKYTIPTATTSASWTSRTFDDSAWETGIGGIGFGDDDDATELTEIVRSVFMRSTFNVTDTSLLQAAVFHMDYDDGFVAYLNGTEIARGNMSSTGYNDLASGSHEAKMYDGGTPDEFVLDMKKIRPLLVQGSNVLSVQVHNNTSTSTDLTSRPFLSFGINSSQIFWDPIPTFFTPTNGGVYLHTNFSLSNGEEPIALFDPNGNPVDGVNLPKVLSDVTYGRQTDGATTFKMFKPATPGATNNGATSYNGIISDKVSFSLPAGFYSSTQSLTLSTTNSNATIKYTTDGSKPTSSSTTYTGSISISSTRVIRAAAFVSGYLTEYSETNTYLIGANDNPKLPVMTISTDPDGFFGFNNGIYELGPNASGVQPNFGANFWEDWEREIHFEYFDENDQLGIEQDCGVKIFGGWSRDQAMKSLRLIGRDEYGDKDFDYKFFKSKNIDSFRQLVLRNSGNDFNSTHFRDALNHEVIKDVGNHDRMAYQPVVVFINGEYWGVHNLRERMNTKYVEDNHGVDDDEINLIENAGAGQEKAKNGDDVDWRNTVNFILNNDLTIAANWNQVQQMIDVPNFIDFFASETYHINWDAPHNNVRVWRPMDNSSGWRYLYYDTDFGLNLFGLNHTGASYNELSRWINDDRSSHSPIFKKLLTNPTFKCLFVNRYADLMNTVFAPSNYTGVADSIKALINDDMERHFDRWGNSYNGWNGEITSVKSFLNARRSSVKEHITSTISGSGSLNELVVNVSPVGAGKVLINTITPKTYEWSGEYFSGCPVQVTVVPNEGYKLDKWSGANTSSNSTISLTMTADRTITANFIVDNNTPKIIFSEINYNSPDSKDAGDWVELFNNGNSSVDLSGWKLKDGNDFNEFIIPNGTTLGVGQYLVLASDLMKFTSIHPTVSNVIGELGFNLSSTGEAIRLYDQFGRIKLTVTYDNNPPWSEIADGKGGTLELLNKDADLNNPSNWFGGCLAGSPGGEYIECPCQGPFLGEDKYLCETGGSLTLNTGLGNEDKSYAWYLNGDKLADTLATLVVSNIGVYSVLMMSPDCIKESSVEILNNIKVDLGNNFELCTPAERELNAGAIKQNTTYIWTRNGVDLNVNVPSLKVTVPGVYKLDVKLGQCTTVSDQITVTSLNPTPVDAKICEEETATLSVQGSSTYKWYATPTGGQSLKTGNSYTTSISKTTTFYVENTAVSAANYFNAGPINHDFGDTWGHDNFSEYKMKFEIFKTCYLNFITVYPSDGTTSITIRITPDEGTRRTITVPALDEGVAQRIALGYELTPGKYTIDAVGTDGELIMNNENSDFPYEDGDGYISIYRTEPDWADDQGWCFFFYNFELGDGPYIPVCDRTPVTAYLCEIPEVVISSSKNYLKSGEYVVFNVAVEGDYSSISWDFGEGASPRYASGVGPHSVLFGVRGQFDIVVTVSNNSENYTFHKTVNVCSTPDKVTISAEIDEYCGDPFLISADLISGYSYDWKLNNSSLGSIMVDKNTITGTTYGDYSVVVYDPINPAMCSVTSNELVIIDCVLNATNSSMHHSIGLYPNPGSTRVFITGVVGGVKIQDIRGATLLEQDSSEGGVDISSLNQGIYILSVKTESDEFAIRLIKD